VKSRRTIFASSQKAFDKHAAEQASEQTAREAAE
jgi:hypothetical protein